MTKKVGYYSAMLKKRNFAICENMNESEGHYAKWNKPDRERQILHGITDMWNLKKKDKSLTQKHRLERCLPGVGGIGNGEMSSKSTKL